MTHKEVFIKEFSQFKDRDVKNILWITIALNSAMLIFDYFVSKDDFIYYLVDRLFINCGISLMLLIFYNSKVVRKNFVYIGFGIYIITGVGQILLLLVESNIYYFSTLFILMIAGVPLFFVAYKGTFMINISMLIIFGIVQWLNYPDDFLTWAISVSVLFLFILMIFGISYFLHRNISSIFFESKRIKRSNKRLLKEAKESKNLIKKMNYDSIYSLAIIAESHDDFTGNHLQRVGELSKRLAGVLPSNIYDDNQIDKAQFVESIELASMLHDIGKIDIPMDILKKNGPLTDSERKVVQTHAMMGYEILTNISSLYENSEVMDLAKEIAKYHHENWDGTGYPTRLSQKEIPLSARIVSITDYYDALSQDRPYRKAIKQDIVLKMLKDNAGVKFDPEIVKIFCEKIKRSK